VPLDDPRRYKSAQAQIMGLNFFDGMSKLLDFYSGKVATDVFMREEAKATKTSNYMDRLMSAPRHSLERQGTRSLPLSPGSMSPRSTNHRQVASPRTTRVAATVAASAFHLENDSDTDEDSAADHPPGEEPPTRWVQQRLWLGRELDMAAELRAALDAVDVPRIEQVLRKAKLEHLERLRPLGADLLAEAEDRLRELWQGWPLSPGSFAEATPRIRRVSATEMERKLSYSRAGSKMSVVG